MLLRPGTGLLMESRDIGLELLSIHTPDPPSADLYRREAAASDQRIDLGNAHAQIGSDVFEREKARLDPGRGPLTLRARRCHAREFSTEVGQELVFEPVCFFLSDDGSARARW